MENPGGPSLRKTMLVAGSLFAGVTACACSHAVAQTVVDGQGDPRRAKSATVVANPDETAKSDASKKDGDRMDPSYQPEGVELGQFLLLPKVEVDEVFNSNIYATNRNEKSDFITVARPELALNSRFERHMLNVLVNAEDHTYAAHNAEDHFDTKALVVGRVDVSDETEINGYAQHLNRTEDRSSPDDIGGKSPAKIYTTEGQLGAKQRFGAFVLSGEGNVKQLDFSSVETSNNTTITNADRDRTEFSGAMRGLYEMFPSYGAVLEVGGNKRDYELKTDRNGVDRSSTGQHVLTGVAVDVSSLIRGDFLVGYMRQDYTDQQLRDVSGPMVRATFNWTPTPQTLIVPTIEHSVAETTARNVSGIKRLSANVLGRYELRRNILLSAFAGVSRDEYEGPGYSTLSSEAWARASYAFNPNVYVAGQIGYRDKAVEDTTGDFDQTVMIIRLGLQL